MVVPSTSPIEPHPTAITNKGSVGEEENELQKAIKRIKDQTMEEDEESPFLWKDGALHDSELATPNDTTLGVTSIDIAHSASRMRKMWILER